MVKHRLVHGIFGVCILFCGAGIAESSKAQPTRKLSNKTQVSDPIPVDLSQVEATAAPESKNPILTTHTNPVSNLLPQFKFLFDTWLIYQPGSKPLTFDSFHYFILVDYLPRPEIRFSTEVNQQVPRFFEVEYRPLARLAFRVGRIWIPFDQMNPHNTFGGFMNTSKMRHPNDPGLFPDLWTDLGVAVKIEALHFKDFELDTEFYVVNGFQEGGTDPAGGGTYPNFTTTAFPDNNNNKAIGARIQAKIPNKIAVGGSVYRGAYSNDGNHGIFMFGGDVQIYLIPRITLRGGYMYGRVGLPDTQTPNIFARAGLYGDATIRLSDKWSIVGRSGIVQPDSRVSDSGDKVNVGGALIYNMQWAQISVQYLRDLLRPSTKPSKEFAGLRFVLML